MVLEPDAALVDLVREALPLPAGSRTSVRPVDGRTGLREVRDGACDLFATTLSPDYNAAHRDHLHLDQAARGARGWRACR